MASRKPTQNTLAGIVIGVVIGLLVALLVALYITKSPMPFVNKGQNRTPEQDTAEELRNRNWDPNAPLANRVKPAESVAAHRPATTPQTPATGPVAAPSSPPASPAPDAEAAARPDPFEYLVQVGSYTKMEDAEAQRAKVTLAGVQAKVTTHEQNGRNYFRVRVGPFDRKEDAEQVKEQLENAGHKTLLVRAQRTPS